MSATITPQLIKELRDRTWVGIGKCKEALENANNVVRISFNKHKNVWVVEYESYINPDEIGSEMIIEFLNNA